MIMPNKDQKWAAAYGDLVTVARMALADLPQGALALGADAVCLADTIGTASPARVTELLAAVGRAVPHVPLGAHFHDTRGMGIANALTAVRLGVTSLDASIGGMGGCGDAVAMVAEKAREQITQAPVIIDHQHMRRFIGRGRWRLDRAHRGLLAASWLGFLAWLGVSNARNRITRPRSPASTSPSR